MTSDKETGDIVIARDDAIYFYGPNGRGPSFAFEGPKKLVSVFRDYVALACPPKVAQLSKGNTLRRFGGSQVDDIFSTSTFSLLDTDLKFVAHSESLTSQIKDLFAEWGDLFLVTIDGKVGPLKGMRFQY